jgi:putative transposase
MEQHSVSAQRACRVVNLPRSMYYYRSKRDDSEVIAALEKLAEKHPNRGFDTYYGRLRQQGHEWNRKRVLRVYRLMKLSLRRKHKRRLPTRVKDPLLQPLEENLVWSMDFMLDALESGRKFRVFNVLDDYNREAIEVTPDFSFAGEGITRLLEDLVEFRGKPQVIRCDNGPEFISKTFVSWCESKGIAIKYIQPGKPSQNAYIERFKRLFREDILDAYLFESIHQVRVMADAWKNDYNAHHPHGSLGGKSPFEFARKRKRMKEVNQEICLN